MLPGIFAHADSMNDDWFDGIASHPLLLPQNLRMNNGSAAVVALLHKRQVSERWPSTELARRQRTMLLAVGRHAATFSRHFVARMKAAGLIPSALIKEGTLSRLPPLTRQELVRAGESLFCTYCPSSHGAISTTSTSGSTGEPVTIRRAERCHLEWLACTLREHLWHQRDFAGRLAVIRANIFEPVEAPDWGPPCNLLFRTGPGSAMPPSCSVQELCQWLLRFDPDHLLVLPNMLAALLTEFTQTGQRPGRLKSIRTLSETVHPELREAASRVLGLPIHDSYTSEECGVMATQCPVGAYHVSETILLEVLDEVGQPCGVGEIGRVVITDLVNFATPLIRYEIGDYAEVGAPCACGRGLPVIRRFLGRERNLVLLPDGTRHWPLVGFHHWSEAHPVRQFQFVQLDRQTILARMAASGRPDSAQEARLTAIIQKALQHPFEIRYEWHETPLPRGPGGKFEEFICRAE
jgi:phenylacetate-CoA ligase